MIEVRNIVKKYGEKIIIDNVSLKLPTKQITAFIGQNGAGKSSLISIISRVLNKDSGEVIIDDKSLEDWNTKDLARKISILSQTNNLNIRLTVRQLVNFGRFPYSAERLTPEDVFHVDRALEYLELKGLEDRYLDELSGGQRQMAFIAMIIAQDTEYIFLDEPLNNLDMKHSVSIMKTLKRLVKDLDKTIMIVIHDINYVACYADYIVALKHGKLIDEGETTSIIDTDRLREIYDMEIDVENIKGSNFCLYYN